MVTASDIRYFKGSIWVTAIGLILSALIGFFYTGTIGGAISMLVVASVLAVLETSLSFDNAVVNAKVLKDMDPVWQHRFITWGMVIAVFGMRVIFPLLIVGVIGHIWPHDALILAATNPAEYERILTEAHYSVAAFGGTFLLMVGLGFFFDAEKEVHWVKGLEPMFAKLGGIALVDSVIAMGVVIGIASFLPEAHFKEFIVSGFFGLLTFALVGSLEHFTGGEPVADGVKKAGAAAFMYLEVLDASFSFDGVIGAFALTNNMFIIAIGLGIGAMFVRSMTIMMVEKGTLEAFRYLEHGAFWAILALAGCMFGGTLVHIPEWVTGLIGAAFIGVAVWTSIRHEKANAVAVAAE